MLSVSRKNIADLRKELIKNLDLDFFDDEEIDSILREVESHDETLQQMIFALCVVLSNKSSSFVPRTLRRIRSASGISLSRNWSAGSIMLLTCSMLRERRPS